MIESGAGEIQVSVSTPREGLMLFMNTGDGKVEKSLHLCSSRLAPGQKKTYVCACQHESHVRSA